MKKRILSLLLTLCMVLSIAPAAVFAEESTASANITGTGGVDDPYLIYTAEGLKAFRDVVNNNNHGSAHAKLMNDIVLNDGAFDADGNYTPGASGADAEKWTPVSNDYDYSGTFDGDGHTIRGLYVTGEQYAGLFGRVHGGTVKNVTVTGYVEGTQFVGGIVGRVNNATISGCANAATVKGGSKDRWSNVGGIVGYLFSGNVINCANLGSVWAQIDSDQGDASVGGIAGFVFSPITIVDCYNAGSIAIQDSGTGIYGLYLGGIIGGTMMALQRSYISNCYSVGPLTYRGSASVAIRGIAGFVNRHSITNCYWLEGTAGSGVGGYPGEASAAAKTKAEFADGTVLALLKGDRTDSPWADECQYVAAAGMTLPVFKGQGDSHEHSEKTGNCLDGIYCECGYLMHGAESEHNWGEWQHLTTSHSRGCDNPGCGVTQSDSCSGGTATCTEQATCEVCHEKYGALNPDNHTCTLEWTQTATTHQQEWSCCGAVTVAEEDHEWENGVCSECGYGCRHTYEWQNENGQYWQKCKFCNHETAKKDIPTINISGADKVCRTQDYKFSFTLPEGATDAAYGYEFIGLGYGSLTPTVADNLYSGFLKATIYPAEENSFKLIVSAKTADGFEFSSEKTVTIQNEHSGGTATCTEKAVCEICGESYGELDPNNHANLKHIDTKAATKTSEGNIEYWYCDGCNKYYKDAKATQEIKQADTVTAKLKDDSNPPQTGDTSNLMLWIALLFISGGVLTGVTVFDKRKRHSVK